MKTAPRPLLIGALAGCLISLFMPSMAWAKIGDTPEACEQRYGKHTKHIAMEELPNHFVRRYITDDLQVVAVFTHDKVTKIDYTKIKARVDEDGRPLKNAEGQPQWTAEEMEFDDIKSLMALNAGEREWEPLSGELQAVWPMHIERATTDKSIYLEYNQYEDYPEMSFFQVTSEPAEETPKKSGGDLNAAIQGNLSAFSKIVPRSNPETGHPNPFTVTLNGDDAAVHDGKKYSGFRFVVKRAGETKEDFDLVWYFISPKSGSFDAWSITKATGVMNRFRNFQKLEPSDYPSLVDWPPEAKSAIFLQGLSGQKLIEGEEYVIWFRSNEDDEELCEITACLGYMRGGQTDDGIGENVEAFLGLKK